MVKRDQPVRFLPCGDAAFSMELGNEIDRQVNAKVIALYKTAQRLEHTGIIAMIPTFRALFVQFDPERVQPGDLQERLMSMLDDLDYEDAPGRRWTLPACYGDEFGPDLADIARQTGMSADEVRETHAGVHYFVYMIGFLPGYAYMGDVPEAIRVPRRENPRTRLPRGSVAVAGQVTSIYPLESPGGWSLIARTPVPMFDPAADMPVLLAPGDMVAFEPISPGEFAAIERDIASGDYTVQMESAS
jgi:KipI family sensor histidine kinase inhibitor